MAYWIQETGNPYTSSNYRSYMCDYRTDIAKLPKQHTYGEPQKDDTVATSPCACGSDCLVLEDGSIWILGKETDEWQEV